MHEIAPFYLVDGTADTFEIAEVPPNQKGPADDILLRHKAPDTAIAAAVPVIAHHKIVAGGYLAAESAVIVRAIFLMRKLPHSSQVNRWCFRIQYEGMRNATQRFRHQFVLRGIESRFNHGIGAAGPHGLRDAIDGQPFVAILDPVARHTNHTFYVVHAGIDGVAEDHYVTALWLTHLDYFLVDYR